MAARRLTPLVSASRWRSAACRVRVAQGLQPLPGRLRGEPGLPGVEPGHRIEQRTVEELLVQSPDLPRVPSPLVGQLADRVAAQAHRPGDPTQVPLVGRDDVAAAQPEQLDPVLHGPQEAVRAVQLGGVRPPDVPVRGQLLECDQGRGAAYEDVAAAVDELEQLHRELHVPQAAPAELELTVGVLRRDRLLHPAPHRLDVLDEPRPVGGPPHQRCERVDVRPAELEVASDRTRLEQRLELPGLRPAVVVGEVAGERPDEGAGLALGAQVGIDRPDHALRRLHRAGPHQRRGEPGRGGDGPLLVAALHRLSDEDDVHVADVVQLAAAALAHRDDGEPGRLGVRRQLRPGDGQGGVQGGPGQVRQLPRHVGQPRPAGQVPRRGRQQRPPVGDPQRVQRGRLGRPGHRLVRARVGPDGHEQVGPQRRGLGAAPRPVVADQDPPVPRVAGQVVGKRRTRAQDGDQRGPEVGVVLHRPPQLQPLDVVRGLGQPDQTEEREVGVRSCGEVLEEDVQVGDGAQCGQRQQALDALHVGEPQPGQPSAGRHRPPLAHSATLATDRPLVAGAGAQRTGR